jgi:hypothetical protein
MPIRLKVAKREEEQISKVEDLMEIFKVPNYNYQQYQLTGASCFSNWVTPSTDPSIQKTKDLFEMFHSAL